MLIGGLQKLSLIDYPGKVATVVFTQGCFFRCHFCHNPSLVLPEKFEKPIPEERFFDFLDNRKNKLDGVVITGGEPTIHQDLSSFIEKIKKRDFLVKLDSAGIFPDRIETLLNRKLIDYIAMDVKAPLNKYEKVTGKAPPKHAIEKSISLIKNSGIDYEFRTTILNELHTPDDIMEILKLVSGSKRYILQAFRPNDTVNEKFSNATTFTNETFQKLQKQAEKYVDICLVR